MRSTFLCKCQCGGGARLDGKVKESESLINTVISNGPKTLTGPTQNGNVAGLLSTAWGSTDESATGGKAEPNPFVRITRNTVNPYRCPVGQVNRKEDCEWCGQRIAEEAKAAG